MYTEEESLPHLYSRLVALGEQIKDYDLEFLFVNDGIFLISISNLPFSFSVFIVEI